ncbi:MAG: hypothetical protein FWH04_08565, partial [Oscillospiraceae bacterium]|nr:hypothetical protein [Oscillospiraceae bacterium]
MTATTCAKTKTNSKFTKSLSFLTIFCILFGMLSMAAPESFATGDFEVEKILDNGSDSDKIVLT